MSTSKSELSDYDKELFRIIECAFGSELDNDEYLFLLWYLYEYAMPSLRSVAITVGRYLNKYYLDIYHDLLGVAGNAYLIPPEQQEKFETQLKTSGFDDWLVEWFKALNPPADNEGD